MVQAVVQAAVQAVVQAAVQAAAGVQLSAHLRWRAGLAALLLVASFVEKMRLDVGREFVLRWCGRQQHLRGGSGGRATGREANERAWLAGARLAGAQANACIPAVLRCPRRPPPRRCPR